MHSLRFLSLGLVITLAATGCASSSEDDEAEAASSEALSDGQLTTAVEAKLTSLSPREKDRSWAVTRGNALPDGWLMQVPVASMWGKKSIAAPPRCSGSTCVPDFDLKACASDADCGGSACRPLQATRRGDDDRSRSVCAGHSDAILDEIYGVMTHAKATVDVSSLWVPGGRFLATMRNALTTLDSRNQPVKVRFLFGSYPGHSPDRQQVLADLTRDMRAGSRVAVAVGTYAPGIATWNHSKIIAADGVEAIVGGMNLSEAHYLDGEPVHDVSIHVRGPAAASAERFLDELWEDPCGSGKIADRTGHNACPGTFAGPIHDDGSEGSTRILAVGRTGHSFRNPADIALVAMMDASRRSIEIVQQDLGSVKIAGATGLNEPILDAFSRAARRGVDIDVVLSNEGSYGGTGRTSDDSYANGWSLADVWKGLVTRGKVLWTGEDIEAELCAHVHLANLRASSADAWPSGSPLAAHAKVVIVDQQAHYVGSQNLYAADLAEFGFIVDDRAATKKFETDWHDKLASYSKRTVYVDPACTR